MPVTRSTSSLVAWPLIACPALTTMITPPSGRIPVAASRRLAAEVDWAAGALKPPPCNRPPTGPPNTPQTAAKASPEIATRHGWREIMSAIASNICVNPLQSVGKLREEFRTPGVEADPESQDLQAHGA